MSFGPVNGHPASTIGIALASGANLLAWVQSFDAGAIASAVTLVGGATVGVVVWGYGQWSKARTRALAEYDEAFRKSLQGEVNELRIENREYQDKLARMTGELERLTRLLEALTRVKDAMPGPDDGPGEDVNRINSGE